MLQRDAMDSSENEELPPIPKDLYSEYEERPFQHCTRCGESLLDFEGGYQVSKAYRNGECVALNDFHQQAVHHQGGIDECSVCGCDRKDGTTEDFVITGLCDAEHLVDSIMICGTCGEQVQELLSTPTKDTWRRFMGDHFPGPPSLDELPEPLPGRNHPQVPSGFSPDVPF
jgi:hypothetical protein